jgi:hypothetical protein
MSLIVSSSLTSSQYPIYPARATSTTRADTTSRLLLTHEIVISKRQRNLIEHQPIAGSAEIAAGMAPQNRAPATEGIFCNPVAPATVRTHRLPHHAEQPLTWAFPVGAVVVSGQGQAGVRGIFAGQNPGAFGQAGEWILLVRAVHPRASADLVLRDERWGLAHGARGCR